MTLTSAAGYTSPSRLLFFLKQKPHTKADISSSKVYEITGKLIKKGLVSSFLKNNVTYYNASDPIFLGKYIEEKEKELQKEKEIVNQILPDLKKLKEHSQQQG